MPAVSDATNLWRALAAAGGVALDDGQIAALGRHLDLLIDANRRFNLTRITDRADAELRHTADALTLLQHLPPGPLALADLGSGGGVPGLVLAVARPDAAVTLIESTGKKADFLTSAAASLNLSNVTVLRERAESVGRGPRRASFDVVTTRAVAAMPWLVEWSLPLLRVGGRLLASKGSRHADELADAATALRLLGAGPPQVHAVDLPGVEGAVIVEVRKVRPTPEKYPRPASAAKGRVLQGGKGERPTSNVQRPTSK